MEFVWNTAVGFILYSCYVYGAVTDNVTELHLIGLFPLSGPWNGGQGMLPAAEMAVDDINNRSDILPGYRLHMEYGDTECNSGIGVKTVADHVCQSPTKIMIIGAGCSPVCQAVAQVSHRWNLIQVSYVSLSPALSDRVEYPNFFRLVSTEHNFNEARMEIFKHFNWRRVATIHQNYQIFSTMTEDIVELMKKQQFKIVAQVIFSEDPETAVRRLKEADARIIVAGFFRDKARKVFCHAYNLGFYGKQVWLMTGSMSYDADWWKEDDTSINCTREQLEEIIQGSLIIDNEYFNPDDTEEGLTRMSAHTFREIFKKKTRNMTQPVSGAEMAATGYDTVWAAALALNKTMNSLKVAGSKTTLADFSYENKPMTDLMKSKLFEVNFTSASGKVRFDSNGDGIRLIGIQMIRGSKVLRVGLFDKSKPADKRLEIETIWKGNVPRDGVHTKRVVDTLSVPSYIIMTSIASLGIVLALAFLFFNITYRNVRIIRLSSPNINNIILFGCILAYLSVYIKDINSTKNCIYDKISIFLHLMAFSSVFGGLFAKTWRIHAIFTASLRMKRLKIKDHILFLMILGLVCLNCLILCIWFMVDPQTIVTEEIPHKKETRDDMIIQHVYYYCSSSKQNYFLIPIMIIQGIFLLLGVFLAWQTRKVKFSIVNESRHIGMCIYNVVALGIVGVLVYYSLRNNVTLLYVIISCITILCTTVTQCLLFVPKVMSYRKFVQGTLRDTTMTSSNDHVILNLPRKTTTSTQTDPTDNNGTEDMELTRRFVARTSFTKLS